MSPRRREPDEPPRDDRSNDRSNDRPNDRPRRNDRTGRPGPGARGDRPRPGGDRPARDWRPPQRSGGGFGFRRGGDGPPRDQPPGGGDRRSWRGPGPRRDRPPFERGPAFDPDRPRPERSFDRPRPQRDFDRPRPQRDFERPRRDRPPASFDRPSRPADRFDRQRPGPRGPWRPPQDAAIALGPDEELVAGRRPVEEAFAAGRPAIRLLVVPQRRDALERLVLHATTLRLPIVEVEGGSLTSVAGFDGHQGVALVVGPRRFATVDEMLARAIELGEPAFLLVLDSLEDPQNVGSLLRSAEAAGVHGVIFPTRRQAPLSPSAVKASGGATEHLLLAAVDDLAGTLADLHGRGVRILGAEAEAALTARQSDLRGPIALVVGSEGQGLGPSVRRRCDAFLRIPMRGKVGSLNAAVAGSILLFEAVEQRLAEGGAVEPEAGAKEAPEPKRRTRASPASSNDSAKPAAAEPTTPKRRTRATTKAAAPAERTPTEDPASDVELLPEAPKPRRRLVARRRAHGG